MKKTILNFCMLFYSINAFGQQNPTPTAPSDPTTSLSNPQKGAYAWYRGGNIPLNSPAGTSNLFGTLPFIPSQTVLTAPSSMAT